MPKVYLVRYTGISRGKIQAGLLEGLEGGSEVPHGAGGGANTGVVMLERKKKAHFRDLVGHGRDSGFCSTETNSPLCLQNASTTSIYSPFYVK